MIQWDDDTQSEFNMQYTEEYKADASAVWQMYSMCPHARTELRRKVATNGQARYYHQCLKCGCSAGAVPRANVHDIDSVADFDPNLYKAYSAERDSRLREVKQKHIRLQKAGREQWWRWYEDYLKTPAWRKKRSLVMNRACGMCEGCGIRSADHVHHLTYDNVGNEFLWELKAICRECHERVHGRQIGERAA